MARKRNTNYAERFWSKVNKNGANGCWIWTASLRSTGYGQFNVNGKISKAHRVAWELLHGEIPKGLGVLHKCDNPICVNAQDHLYLGTQKENIQDWKERNIGAIERQIANLKRGDQHYSRTNPEKLCRGDKHPSRLYSHLLPHGDDHHMRKNPLKIAGSKNGMAKINEEIALEIFKASGRHSKIALKYNINKTTVTKIKARKLWKHVTKDII